jgi:hypothetical protein
MLTDPVFSHLLAATIFRGRWIAVEAKRVEIMEIQF